MIILGASFSSTLIPAGKTHLDDATVHMECLMVMCV